MAESGAGDKITEAGSPPEATAGPPCIPCVGSISEPAGGFLAARTPGAGPQMRPAVRGWGEGVLGANDRQLFLLQEACALGAQEGPARLLSCQGSSDHHEPISGSCCKPDSQGSALK